MEIRFLKATSPEEEVKKPWQPWFAWHPVWLENGRCVFWETVLRKSQIGEENLYWIYRSYTAGDDQ